MITSRRLTLVVSAILALAVLLPTAPAAAIGVLPAPSPSDGSSSGSGGSPGGGSGSFSCRRSDNRGVDTIGRVWYDKYPGCAGYRHTGYFAWCPTGFEVWRFYGTVANPIQSYTVSKVNIDSHQCTGGKSMLYHEIHPDDSPQGVWPGMGVWRTSINEELNTLGHNNSRTVIKGRQYYTTNVPFARHGRSCTTLQASNTRLRSYQPGGAAYDSPIGPAVRQWLKARYDTFVSAYDRPWGNALFDVVSRDSNGALTQGDDWDCSSPFDFQVQIPDGANVETHPSSRVTGICAIPTMRWSERFAGAYGYWWQGRRLIFEEGQFNGGREMYGALQGNLNPPLATRQLNNARDQYRSTINHEVIHRAPVNLYINHGTHPPAAMGNQTGPYNRTAAAYWAAHASWCTASYAGAWYANEQPHDGPGGVPGTGVELNVAVPEVGQVGGLMRAPANISATPGRVLCNNSSRTPCPTNANGPRLRGLVTTGPNQARLQLTPPANADWRVRPGGSNLNGFVAPNRFNLPASGARAWPLDFFAATSGDDRYEVTASGRAVIEGTVNANSGMRMCWSTLFAGAGFQGCENIGGSGTTTVTREVDLVPVYNAGTPREGQNRFPVIGATATPIEDRQG